MVRPTRKTRQAKEKKGLGPQALFPAELLRPYEPTPELRNIFTRLQCHTTTGRYNQPVSFETWWVEITVPDDGCPAPARQRRFRVYVMRTVYRVATLTFHVTENETLEITGAEEQGEEVEYTIRDIINLGCVRQPD